MRTLGSFSLVAVCLVVFACNKSDTTPAATSPATASSAYPAGYPQPTATAYPTTAPAGYPTATAPAGYATAAPAYPPATTTTTAPMNERRVTIDKARPVCPIELRSQPTGRKCDGRVVHLR